MEKMIAFCGLVCTECRGFIATQNNDEEMLKRVAAQFNQELNVSFAPEDWLCDGCLALEGRLASYCRECKIKACGIENKVQNCAHCDDYPCGRLEEFFALVPYGKATLDGIRQSL